MFKGIFENIMGTISNLNPLKRFIKYALDKTLNQLLKKQLTLDDFRNGPLNLQNIEINTDKINKTHLVSSPYIMHYGIISNLKIILPPLSELSTQSIEISVSGVQILLKPNKKFSENFKQKMSELREMQKYYVQEKEVEGEICETGPVDFFKQLLKKIILNIKVNISNIAIKLYMNTPSQTRQSSQFYLMLRIPLIYLDKKSGKQAKQQEEINFNILLPQITVHLLNEDNVKNSEYRNVKFDAGDFPFKYPSANHPKTILLIGSPILPENIVANLQNWKKDGTLNNMNFSQMGFKLSTDYKKKTKDITLHFEIANIQAMVSPSQIKILSRFVAQVMQFKNIYHTTMDELKYEASQTINFNRLKSNQDRGKNNDLFSSIMMSLSNDMETGKPNVRGSSDMFKSIIGDDKAMWEGVREFNKQFGNQMKKMQGTQSLQVQIQVIQFKQNLKVHIQFKNLTAYILKYSPNQQFLRIWRASQKSEQLINKKIAADYFMLQVKKVDIVVKATQKVTSISLKSLAMYNVKLNEDKQMSAQSFYDIGNSVDFETRNTKQSINCDLHEYYISKQSHFCVEEIVSVSHSQSQSKKQQLNLKKYSLIPQLNRENQDEYILYKPGVAIHIDNKQKYLKINIQVIIVSTNLQLMLDLLNIAYPLMAYKRLADIINFKRNEVSANNSQKNTKVTSKKNMYESAYEFREDLPSVQDLKSQNKNTMVLEVVEVKLGFRKGEMCWKSDKGEMMSNFADLIKKQKQKIFEQQAFNKICFCNICQPGIYLQLTNLKLQKKLSAIKVSCKVIDIGIMKIDKSKITSLSSILEIKTTRPDDSIRILKQMTYCNTILVYIPELNGRFSEDDIVNVTGLSVDSIKIVSCLIKYKEYLEREMLFLDQKSSEMPKKGKKSESATEKQIRIYLEKTCLELDYCNFIIQQIYLSLNPQMQQAFGCKISKIIGGIKRQKALKMKICEFSNGIMQASMYPDYEKKNPQKFINDGDIFMQLGDKQKQSMILKVEERVKFIQKLQKQNFSFVFKLTKKILASNHVQKMKEKETENSKIKSNFKLGGGSGGTMSQKFRFKQVNQAIEEEGEKKILHIEINKETKINVCNMLELKTYVNKIETFAKYMKSKMQQAQQKLKSQTLLLIQRKQSVQIENQSIELIVQIGPSILIDIRPDFIRNESDKIFSNTRSIISLTLHNPLTATLQNNQNQKQLSFQLSLQYFFLSCNDRQINLHPLTLHQDKHRNQLGFKTILQLNRISTKININDYNKMLNIKIKSILGQASISTLYLLQLHFQHFIQHHVKNQLGISQEEMHDGEDFQELVYDPAVDPDLEDVVIVGQNVQEEEELEIEDLSGAFQLYNLKLKYKKQQQQRLRSRTYTFQPCQNPLVTVQQLSIQKVCLRISEQNDFDFIKFQGVSQSLMTKRTRNKQPQQINYYTVIINNMSIKADVAHTHRQSQMQMDENNGSNGSKQKQINTVGLFFRIQKVQVCTGMQKFYGHCVLKPMEAITSASCFIILQNQNQIIGVFQKNPFRILVKLYSLKLRIGGTTLILDTLKKLKSVSQAIDRTGWRKIYPPNPHQSHQPQPPKSTQLTKKDTRIQSQRLIIMVPQSTIKITFQYSNILKILDEQTLTLKQLILNEEVNENYQIKRIITRWLKSIAKDNIAGLISGTALNLLVKLVSQLVSLNIWWLSKIFGVFFNANQ